MSSAPVGQSGSVCTTCGEVIEPGTMFCGSCGSRVPAPAPVASSGSPAHPTYPAPTSSDADHAVAAVPAWATVEAPATPAPEPLPLLADPPPAVSPYPAPDAGHRAPVPARASQPAEQAAVAPGSVAPVPVRVGAYAIDVALTLVVYVAALLVVRGATSGSTTLSPLAFLPGLLLLVVGLAQWISEAVTGATFGGFLTGIRTLSAETGRPAGLVRVLLRNLVVAAGALACGIGAFVVQLSGLWDHTPAQRGWHDKAAGTVVLRASASGRRPAQPDAAAWDSAVARAVGQQASAPAGTFADVATDAAPVPAHTGAMPLVAPTGAVPLVAAPTGPVPSEPAPSFPVPAVPSVPPTAAREAVDLLPPAPVDPASPPQPAGGTPGLITGPPPGVVGGRHAAPHAGADAPVVAPVTASLPVIDGPGTAGLGIGVGTAPTGTPEADRTTEPGLGDLEHTRLRPSGAAPVRTSTRGVALRLVFDTGERVDVVGEGLVGRSPGAEPGVVHLVAIDDPERSVSKVHLAFGLDRSAEGPRLWVIDRGSTNGTVLVRPDGSGATLPAGRRAVVEAGWTVCFGSRNARVETV